MNKLYKPVIIGIIFSLVIVLFSGFGLAKDEDVVYGLLNERAYLLQRAYYGKISLYKAEDALYDIETQPLLGEDIDGIRYHQASDMDMIKNMKIVSIKETKKLFNIISYKIQIKWYMDGLNGEYETECEYSVVIKNSGGSYKLSEFEVLKD